MSKAKFSDSELIQKVLAGEIELFGVLIDRYEKLVFSFLMTRVKQLQEVEDIAQETFVKAFKHLKSFDCDKKFAAWLLTIARNIMIDQLRRNNRNIASTEMVTEVMLKDGKSSDTNPQTLAIRKEEFKKVVDMIYGLPEEVREPFVLRIVNGLSYQEISEALELPLQTIKNRIFKARTMLRDKREKHEEMP
ncbi:MAG: sigma-70 family RNA polymerase sigma factor [Candidatus Rifleibacteriota bacterium]